MKKIVALFIVFSLFLTMIIGASAESSKVEKGILSKQDLIKNGYEEANRIALKKVTISEYDLIKNYFGKSYDQLLKMGIDGKQAKEFANLENDIIKKVKELYLLDDKSLIEQGYNQKQIESIRSINTNISKTSSDDLNTLSNFETLSPLEIRGIFGDVTMSVDLYDFTADDIYVYFDWNWDGKPFMLMTDGIGFSWDGGFRTSSNELGANVNYVGGNNSGTKEVTRDDIDILAGAGWGFDMQMAAGPSHTAPAWAESGEGGFWLTNPNNKNSIQMIWKYGHSTINLTAACVDIKGTLSIGFAKGVEEMFDGDNIWSW